MVVNEEQILKFSMNQIIEYLRGEDDLISYCLALRLDYLYTKQLINEERLQRRIDQLECDIEDMVNVINGGSNGS